MSFDNDDKKPHLLVVEDDFENQEFLRIYLKRWFEVTTCDSDTTFYAALDSQSWDIILMDILIRGEKDGLQLTREIKRDPKYSIIPVVCYTAHAFDKDRVNALKAGSDSYISKPSDYKVLLLYWFNGKWNFEKINKL